jgi:Flp pilus assembly pilin Flp
MRDEAGAEVIEYAVVFALFTIVGIAAVQALALVGNNAAEGDESNFSSALVNGY